MFVVPLILTVVLHFTTLCVGEEVHLMEGYDPDKGSGQWYVMKRNTNLFDSVKCIKFALHHDEGMGDIYKMLTHWINSKGVYEDTHFNVVDDRDHKARFFFESDRDRVAISVLGTNYDGFMVGFGVVGPRRSYFIASRKPSIAPEDEAAIDAIVKKNLVGQTFNVIDQSGCPDGH